MRKGIIRSYTLDLNLNHSKYSLNNTSETVTRNHRSRERQFQNNIVVYNKIRNASGTLNTAKYIEQTVIKSRLKNAHSIVSSHTFLRKHIWDTLEVDNHKRPIVLRKTLIACKSMLLEEKKINVYNVSEQNLHSSIYERESAPNRTKTLDSKQKSTPS